MFRFPLYFVASSNARALDARGWRPGLVLQLMVLVPAAFMLLLAAVVVLLVVGIVVHHAMFPSA